jgi:hypothetical protein
MSEYDRIQRDLEIARRIDHAVRFFAYVGFAALVVLGVWWLIFGKF